MVEEVKVREGYKKTEVGVIPEDWEVKKLGDLIDYTKGYAFKSSSYTKSGVRIIRVSDTDYDSIRDLDEVYIDENDRNKYEKWSLLENDIILSTVGSKPPMYNSMVGKAIRVNSKHVGSLLNQNAVRITVKNKKIASQLLIYYNIKTKKYLNHIEKIFRGNANQASITLLDLFKFKILVSKSYDEQEAIATALTDIDNLIQSLKKLIEKKEKIKQGTMQLLLTGKKRLPGFSGELIKLQLKDILELNKGSQLNRNTLSEKGDYPVINGGIEPSGYTSVWNCSEETITISEGGNSCGYVNFLRTKFWSGGHLYTVKLKYDTIYKQYLYYLLKFNEPKIMSLRVGSGLPNIQKKSIGEFQLNFMADYDEQKAIAQVLSDMDSEIEALEQKLEKLKSIKQGMMQELLTGRIRLI